MVYECSRLEIVHFKMSSMPLYTFLFTSWKKQIHKVCNDFSKGVRHKPRPQAQVRTNARTRYCISGYNDYVKAAALL